MLGGGGCEVGLGVGWGAGAGAWVLVRSLQAACGMVCCEGVGLPPSVSRQRESAACTSSFDPLMGTQVMFVVGTVAAMGAYTGIIGE